MNRLRNVPHNFYQSISESQEGLRFALFYEFTFTSGLNDIFHLCVHLDIFCRSLFNTSAEVLLSCTTENREVLSTKNFTVYSMSFDKSLIYIRKRVHQEYTLVVALILQATILKSGHSVGLYEIYL